MVEVRILRGGATGKVGHIAWSDNQGAAVYLDWALEDEPESEDSGPFWYHWDEFEVIAQGE